jgi:hypothetical protein
MAANIRWDLLIAHDQEYERAFSAAYDVAEEAGLDPGTARQAWRSYVGAVRAGTDAAPYSGAMMTGFMLGTWLRRDRPSAAAAAVASGSAGRS